MRWGQQADASIANLPPGAPISNSGDFLSSTE
jgi:hypothetical protein